MNTRKVRRLLNTTLTVLVILVQLISPLSVLAREQVGHTQALPPATVKSTPPSATESPPLSSEEAKADVVRSLQALLNMPSDAPPEVAQAYRRSLDESMARYAKIAQSADVEATAPSDVGDAPVRKAPAPVSQEPDDRAFLWYMQAYPSAMTGTVPFQDNGTSWLMVAEPKADRGRFDESFSRLMEAGLDSSKADTGEEEHQPAANDAASSLWNRNLLDDSKWEAGSPAGETSGQTSPGCPASVSATTTTGWNTNLVTNGTFTSGSANWTEKNINDDAFVVYGTPSGLANDALCKGKVAWVNVPDNTKAPVGWVAQIRQVRDLSDIATSIDTGRVRYVAAADLGGYEDQEDKSVVVIYFQDQDDNYLGDPERLWGPTAGERGNVTKCVHKETTELTVPKHTRKLMVVVNFHNPDTHSGERSIDAYTDNIIVKLIPRSDLSVVDLSSPTQPVNAGAQFDLQLWVLNRGEGYTASTANLTISNLPSGTTLKSSQPSGCSQAGGTGADVTCNLGEIQYGDSAQVKLTFQSGTGDVGSYDNVQAHVTGQWGDPNEDNNTGTFPAFTIQPNADLWLQADVPTAVTKQSSGSSSYDVQVTVSNQGPSKATGVTLTNTLPSTVTLSSVPSGCTLSGSKLLCDLGTLGVGSNKTVAMQLQVPEPVDAGTLLPFSAQVSGNGNDPGPKPNSVGPLNTLVTYWDADIGDPGPGGTVYALARSSDTLYAGGSFGVKSWDGSSWSTLGSTGGTVYALTVINSALYAGGTFGVKKRDGSSWVGVGSGGPTGTVYALARSGSTLYAGGDFGVQKWTGSWSTLGSPGGTVHALALGGNGTLYAGGDFGIRKWDGSEWMTMGVDAPGSIVYALTVSGDDLYAGGSFYGHLARYDGNNWVQVSGVGNTVRALAANGPEIFAGGDFIDAGGNTGADKVARWNGVDTWTSLGKGTSGRVHALMLGGGSVYVGGEFDKVDGTYVSSGKVGRWSKPTTDLSLTKSVSPGTVYSGEQVDYTLSVHNNGSLSASSVSVRDTLPPGFAFTSASPDKCSASSRTVTCSGLGSLNAGESTTLHIYATAAQDAGTYRNVAVVGSNQPEITNGSNNIAAVDVTVERRQADLSLTKTALAGTRIDRDITYTLTIANGGPDDAANVVLTDTLPSQVGFVSATPGQGSCAHDAANHRVTCNLGAMPSGASVGVTIVVHVPAAAAVGTAFRNDAIVRSDTDDPDTSNNSASASTTVEPYADLVLSKTAPSTVKAGELLSYQITVTNNGPNDADSVTVTDTLPSDVNFDASQSDPNCNASGSTVICNQGTVSDGGQTSFAIVAGVPSNLASGTVLTNNAVVGSDAHEDSPGNETDSASTTVETEADLTLTKSAPATVKAGDRLTYTLTVVNHGPSQATGVVLTNTLPSDAAFVSAALDQGNCTHDAAHHRVTCDLGAVDKDGSVKVQIVVSVPEDLSSGTTLTNQASVSSGVSDPTTPNSASASTTVETEADLRVEKTAPVSVMAGRPLTYTITVTNEGPSRATGVQLTDDLPPEVSYASVTPSQGTCAYDPANHRLSCDLGTLTGGGIATVVLVVDVPSDLATGTTLTNHVGATSGVSDPTTPNEASATTTVETEADLSLTKSAPGTVKAGEQLSYQIQVTNHGPSIAANVVLTDDLPTGVTFNTATPGSPTCTHTGSTVTCNLGSLDSGSSRTVTILVNVSPDLASGTTLTNHASVRSDTPDSTPGDDRDSTDTTVRVAADLQPHKTAPGAVYIEGRILYRLSVTNHGPSQATNVVLTDHLPSGTVFADASQGCSHSGSTVTCSVGALGPGITSSTYTITVTLDQSLAEGTVLENTVTASASSPDPNDANDSAAASTTVTRDPSNLQADLSLDKTAPATVYAGGTLDYVLHVYNGGALDATGVTVVDDLPPEADFVSATPDQGSCAYDATRHRVTCDLGDLVNGAGSDVGVTVSVPSLHVDETITNTASVSASEDDWNKGNNSDSASTLVTPSADLSVEKSGPSTVYAGEQLTYRITVTNHGPNYAPNVALTDTLPAGVTFESASPDQGTCRYDQANRLVTCDLNTVPAGHDVVVSLIAGVPSTMAPGTSLIDYVNIGSGAHEESPGDETASFTTVVETDADLDLSKSGTPDPVDAGGELTYELAIVNHGPSQASGVRVTDTLPAEVSFVSVSPNGTTCTHSGEAWGGTIVCDLENVARNGIENVSIAARVRDDLAPGSNLENSAVVGADTFDDTPGNDADSVSTSVQTRADLEAHKTAPHGVYVEGHIEYELSVTNHGPSQAEDVLLTDNLPPGTTFADAGSGCVHAGNTVTCTVGTLGVGETSQLYTVTVAPDPSLPDGTVLQNIVTASSGTADPVLGNDTATASTTVSTDPTNFQADLRVLDGAPPTVNAGEPLLYVIMVHNLGGLDATGVVISDTLPPGVDLNTSRVDPTCAGTGGVVTCHIGALAAGERRYVPIVVDVPPWATEGTVLRNVASAHADQNDWVPGNNSDDALTTITRSSDLAISKSATARVKTGELITYTLDVLNNGPSQATGVLITDTLPSGVVFVGATVPGGTCSYAGGDIVTCRVDSLGRWKHATAVLTAMAADSGTQTNVAVVSSDVPDPNLQDNSASAATQVEASGPQTRIIGNVTVTANAFVDMGGNRVRAFGDVKLGDHYRLEGGAAILDYDDDSITGNGTLVLDVGDLALFDGNFTASGDSGVLTPAAGVTYELQKIAGFDLQGAPTIAQVNLISGRTTGQATLHLNPPGVDAALGMGFTIDPGPVFGGKARSSFSLDMAGCAVDVTDATLSDTGIHAQSSTLTLPDRFGGGSTSFAGLSFTPTSVYVVGGGGSFALPDIKFGAGTHLWIKDLTGTLSYAFGAFVLQASGTVMVSIPNNVVSASVEDLFLDSQGNLSGGVDLLTLTVAGGPLKMESLQFNNDGLVASTAQWTLPSSMGGSDKVYLQNVAITADGVDLSSTPRLGLPDLHVGQKATFTNMKGRLVKTEDGMVLSISGVLKLFLPQNDQDISFTAQLDTQGNFQGSLDKLTLKLASLTLELANISFDNTGLSVAKGTLTLPEDMGGVTATVSDVRIDKNGLSIGGGGVGIPLPDFDMGGGVFKVTDGMLTFEISADHTFKVTISATIQLQVKSLDASATASISVDSLGNVTGSVESFSITVAGLGLAIEEARIDKDGFFAAKAAFQVPGSWGGLTAEVYNISINKDGISIGGGKFKLPDVKVGSITLAGLEGSFIETDEGYEISAGGKFVIPGLGGGSNCGIAVSVTFFVDKSGQTVALIEAVEKTTPAEKQSVGAQRAAPVPGGESVSSLKEISAEGRMHPSNFTPDDVDEIEGFALRNVTVALEGCAIPIGETGFYLTRVSGSLTLNQGTTRIDLGVTVTGGPTVFGVAAISGDVDLGLQFNPFELDMEGAISLFSIFKMAEINATIRKNFFSADLHIVQIWPPFEGEASLTVWTDDGFHLVGRATLTLGLDKGALGTACVPVIQWPCVDLPPFDMRLAEIGAEFGEFVKDEGTVWGLKAWVTVGIFALDLTVTIGVYFDAGGDFHIGNVDEYHTVTPPSVARARRLWQDARAGKIPAGSLSASDREILRTYSFQGDDIYVSVPVAAPRDLMILLSRVTEHPTISLIRPDGMEITPDNTPDNVGFEVDRVTGKDSSGNDRTATQVMVVVKAAMPGTWQVKLGGPLGEDDQYVLQVNGIDPEPVLRDLTAVSTGPTTAEFGWSLVSNDITTTLNIYATAGPITTTQTVTDSNGVAKQVTMPEFTGAPIATAVPTPLDGTPGHITVDLSNLPTGRYHIWFDADDGRNPPVRVYAPNTIDVVQAWQPSWKADLHAEAGYRRLTLRWDRSSNPDTDVYHLRVSPVPGEMSAQGIRVAHKALNTPPEIDVGDVLSTTLYNLAPGQPYYISVLAVDEDTGQKSQSEEIAAVPEGAPFDLRAASDGISLNGGGAASTTVYVTTDMAPYPSEVSLRPGDHPDGITLSPSTELVTPTSEGVPVEITVRATRGIPGGTYTVDLVGSGGGVERTLPLKVTVVEPSFDLVADPASVTLGKGESAVITISAQGRNYGDGSIYLGLDSGELPAWLLYRLSDSIVPVGGNTTLILTDTDRLANGTYTLHLTGRDGIQTRHLDIPLTVEKPGFSLSTPQVREVGLYSETITYTLNLSGYMWDEPVTLSLDNPVHGSTVGFVKAPGTPPTGTVSVTVPAQVYLVARITPDAGEGTYRLNMRAASDGQEQTLPLELVVQSEATGADVGVFQPTTADAIAGMSYVYTATVTNYGPLTARNVAFTDTLPVEHVSFISATPAQGSCAEDGGVVRCDLGDLPRNGRTTVAVELFVEPDTPAGTLLANEARVGTSGSDPAMLNNRHTGNASVRSYTNLALIKSDAPDPVAAGDNLHYHLTIVNYGPSDAHGVTVRDDLPSQVTFASATAGQGTCGENHGTVTCDLGDLSAEHSAEVTLDVSVDSAAQGTITNTAAVSGDEDDPAQDNNVAAVETTVSHQADLGLGGSTSPSPATAGRNLAYTFLVTNRGPSDAADVTLTDVLPDGVAFVSASPSGGCGESGGTVTCSLGSVRSGESIIATVIVHVGSGAPGTLWSHAQVRSSADDPHMEDNAINQVAAVTRLSDLWLRLSDAPDPVMAGGSLSYTILVGNDGPSDADGVRVRDVLPPGVHFLTASADQGSCAESGGVVDCDLGGVPVGGNVTVVITVAPNITLENTLLRDTATVSATPPDPNAANNSVTATTLLATGTLRRYFLPVAFRSHAP